MERRIHRRFPRRIELRFWRPADAQTHTGYTTNISKSGLFLGSAAALMPGERLRLEIVDRQSGFFAEGRVARVHRVALALRHVDQPGVGVRFLLPEELVEELVPLARQSGPVTQGGQALDPADFPPYDQATDEAFPEEAGDHPEPTEPPERGKPSAPQAPPLSAHAAAREAVLDTSRDKIVPVSFADSSAFLGTYHRDITAGGLFVSTATPMALSEKVWIELHLPLPGERPKLFAARVIQRFSAEAAVGPGKNVLAGMAVQFLDPERVLAELKPLLPRLRG
jgi:Tfp pilus assembly protein PilZ